MQVGDLTIDGPIFPVSDTPSKPEKRAGHTAVFSEFLDRWHPIQAGVGPVCAQPR